MNEGTTVNPAPDSQKTPGKKRKGWTREDWDKRAREAGIDPAGLSIKKIRAKLKKLKDAGELTDKRSENGGHTNGGRKDLGKDPAAYQIKQEVLMEMVDVTIHDRAAGVIRNEKKATMRALLDMLRQEALNKKSIPAAKEFFDRTLGRPKQEVELSGMIDVEEQRMPTKADIAAAEAYLAASEEEEE